VNCVKRLLGLDTKFGNSVATARNVRARTVQEDFFAVKRLQLLNQYNAVLQKKTVNEKERKS
jgi:hypothetical protein